MTEAHIGWERKLMRHRHIDLGHRIQSRFTDAGIGIGI